MLAFAFPLGLGIGLNGAVFAGGALGEFSSPSRIADNGLKNKDK